MEAITENIQGVTKPVGKFKPGQSGNLKGRPKGKKNKKNEILDEAMAKVVALGYERFLEQMMKLEGKAYTDTYMASFEFVRGKIARSETTTTQAQDTKRQVLILNGQEFEM